MHIHFYCVFSKKRSTVALLSDNMGIAKLFVKKKLQQDFDNCFVYKVYYLKSFLFYNRRNFMTLCLIFLNNFCLFLGYREKSSFGVQTGQAYVCIIISIQV